MRPEKSTSVSFFFSITNELKYVKVPNLSTSESLESIMGLLFGNDYWNMRMPELVISVTGGANLKLTHTLKETFGKALVQVATDTSK